MSYVREFLEGKRYMCERCNEYVDQVTPTEMQDNGGYWNLCAECLALDNPETDE